MICCSRRGRQKGVPFQAKQQKVGAELKQMKAMIAVADVEDRQTVASLAADLIKLSRPFGGKD